MKDYYKGFTKCLIVQTEFSAFSFWNYQDICKMVGAKYPATPLGLLTLAALLPQHWIFKLIDENVEPLLDEHLKWADIVCTGGMLPQQNSMLAFIKRAHNLNCKVVIGGPDPTSQPELYSEADFLVLGEGEVTVPLFLKALQNGAKSGVFKSDERADMSDAVVPRYDLIRFSDYIMIGVQFIRGCPYNCEFCDIIELYGRVPRFKTNEQVIKELQNLYDLGHRGHIDFVDDNFIGNKKKAKELLREIKKWTIAHKYPFYFTTEASINLAEDDELLQLMKDVDFRYVFLGIETPENETLALNQKNQNVNKSVKNAVQKIMSYGIVCNGGFIIGFDSESPMIADNMIASIQSSGICMAMLGLLYALPNTQLTKRLDTEGRLFKLASKTISDLEIDQSTSGLNFITKKSRIEVINNYLKVIKYIYEPVNYYNRVIYNAINLKPSYKFVPSFRVLVDHLITFFAVCGKVGFNKQTGYLYWKMFFIVLFRNPKAIEPVINLAAMFIHFQKQRNYVVTSMTRMKKHVEDNGEAEFYKTMTAIITEPVEAGLD
jgi:radical SAM superfamily enzyme YgiQ (UPF0313 family)